MIAMTPVEAQSVVLDSEQRILVSNAVSQYCERMAKLAFEAVPMADENVERANKWLARAQEIDAALMAGTPLAAQERGR